MSTEDAQCYTSVASYKQGSGDEASQCEVESWILADSSPCNNPESDYCKQAHICKAASTTDPCDAPERCYAPPWLTTPTCWSSKASANDQRFKMAVSGLPNSNAYQAWTGGGTSTGFLSSFNHDAIASQASYSTTNPSILAGVKTTCGGVSVNRRAQFYWAVSSSVRAHTPPPHGHPASQLTS